MCLWIVLPLFESLKTNNKHYILKQIFRQLIHGEECLQRLERLKLVYQTPKGDVIIKKCGVYTIPAEFDKIKAKLYEQYKERAASAQDNYIDEAQICTCFPENLPKYPPDIADPRDVSSKLNVKRYNRLLYSQYLEPKPPEQDQDGQEDLEVHSVYLWPTIYYIYV